MAYEVNKYKIACCLLLLAISIVIIASAYGGSGVGWDFLSRYLNGRTIASSYLYGHLGVFDAKVPINVSYFGIKRTIMVSPPLAVSKNIYFDNVWEPLPSVLMGVMSIAFGGRAMLIYLVFLLVLLFAAAFVAAKKLDVDPLILFSLMVGPYVLLVLVLYNGAEILAMGLALILIGYTVQNDFKSGFWAALLGMAKYDGMIMLPLLLLLGKKKAAIKAIGLTIIVTIPWLIFNFLLFGNPLQSYLAQIVESQPQAGGIGIFTSLLGSIVWYPLVFLVGAGCALAYLERDRLAKISPRRHLRSLMGNQRSRVVVASLALALVGFALVYASAQGSIRLGYMVYLSVAIIATIALSRLSETNMVVGGRHRKAGRIVPYAVFMVSLVLLLNLYAGWSAVHFDVLGSLGSNYPIFLQAANALKSNGLGNCSVVSNAWPYMNFYNVTAYSPDLCNATIEKMPIVAFNGLGVANYCTGSISNISGISRRINYPNFSIYIPENYTCRS